jgi:uncharacterized protein (TIGR02453 family)
MLFEGFGPGAVRFFEELAADNTREWWHAHKAWYESDVRGPLEHLLQDLADEFGEAKVFRPNRDTRFSPDKSPYKTQAAATVAEGTGTGVQYMALSAEGLTVAGGCYMPAKDQLTRLREAIDDTDTGTQLEAIVADLREAKARVEARETLKTAPRGYPVDHPRIELLRGKGIIGYFEHTPQPWLQTPRAREVVAEGWRSLEPLNTWLDLNVGPSTLPATRR